MDSKLPSRRVVTQKSRNNKMKTEEIRATQYTWDKYLDLDNRCLDAIHPTPKEAHSRLTTCNDMPNSVASSTVQEYILLGFNSF